MSALPNAENRRRVPWNSQFVLAPPIQQIAEPRATVLRACVHGGETVVAYEAVVLGALRPGYRSLSLRRRLGTLLLELRLPDRTLVPRDQGVEMSTLAEPCKAGPCGAIWPKQAGCKGQKMELWTQNQFDSS